MDEPQAGEVLCHEWADTRAWHFIDPALDPPDSGPAEFERASHDEA
jgi:hypothetical protein